MELSPYLQQIILGSISALIIFLILIIIAKNVIVWGNIRMLISLIISIALAVFVITYFNIYIKDFITIKLWFENYILWKTIIEGILVSLIFVVSMKNYLLEKKWLLIWILMLSSYIIVAYWISPAIFSLFNFILKL